MGNKTDNTRTNGRIAGLAANLLHGAAGGGIYGAAAGAAKSLLPEVLKGLAALLITALLLPLFVFLALPNILFGFDSATDDQIVSFTDAAQGLYSLYQDLDRLNESAVSRLVDRILPDITAPFTRYSVEQNLGNLNLYWLVAIGCVEYRQNVYAMDEDTLIDFLAERLVYTTSLAGRLLTISVWDLTPEGFMDKLGFTEEERDWAALLNSTLSEDQHVSYEDSDGAGWYDTDYGDISFDHANTPVVYYNQTDSRWGSLPYGKSGSIGAEGCGPTALAIVVATLTEHRVTPLDVAEWSAQTGHRCEGNGSYHSLIPDGGRHYGLTVTGIGNSSEKLTAALSQGKLVIALMSKGHFTNGGHFIVLRGITEDGKVLVADPASVKRSRQSWELSIIVSEARRGAAAGGPFWVFST